MNTICHLSARWVPVLFAIVFLSTTYPFSAEAKTWIDAYREKDYESARMMMEPLAEDGDSKAQMALGLIYHRGLGVEKDLTEAAKWYRMAAESGSKGAQNNLGVMFRRGKGVEKDLKEAFALIWMAAVQGYPRAEFNIADMYSKGEGVPKNLIFAYVWLEFAVSDLPKSGRHAAINLRAKIVTEMTTEDVIRAEQMAKALRQAREAG